MSKSSNDLPAAAVGAPHRRYRVFIVAHARFSSNRGEEQCRETFRSKANRSTSRISRPSDCRRAEDVADTEGKQRGQPQAWDGGQVFAGGGEKVCYPTGERLQNGQHETMGGRQPNAQFERSDWRPTQSSLGVLADEFSLGLARSRWLPEPRIGRVAKGIPDRVAKLRCLGNAVVPAVAQWIGERIMAAALDARREAIAAESQRRVK